MATINGAWFVNEDFTAKPVDITQLVTGTFYGIISEDSTELVPITFEEVKAWKTAAGQCCVTVYDSPSDSNPTYYNTYGISGLSSTYGFGSDCRYWPLGSTYSKYWVGITDYDWDTVRILDFGTEPQEVTDDFYNWFTTFATRQDDYRLEGTWSFNNNISTFPIEGYDGYHVAFTVTGLDGVTKEFSRMRQITTSAVVSGLEYSTRLNYYDWQAYNYETDNWIPCCQTISFKWQQIVSEEFYTWFTENATQHTSGSSSMVTFDLSTLSLAPGTYDITVKSRADGHSDSAESGIVIYTVEGSSTNLISFTIGGTSYQAEEGMTWGEWCDSAYNTGGFGYPNGFTIMDSSYRTVRGEAGRDMWAEMAIIASYSYQLVKTSSND